MSKILFSASIAILALGMSGPTFAQEMTLNGTVVPADQVERIQARCDEAFAADPQAASGMGAGTEQDTKTAADTTPENSDDEDVDFATLDLATVTAEACLAGGFTPSTAN